MDQGLIGRWELYLPNHCRLPFSRTPIGFIVAVLLSLIMGFPMAIVYIAVATIYISICVYIGSCMADISAIADHANETIKRKASIKCELDEIIKLHLHCYRFV